MLSLNLSAPHKTSLMMLSAVVPAPEKWKQENQESKVICGYVVNTSPAWVT